MLLTNYSKSDVIITKADMPETNSTSQNKRFVSGRICKKN